LKTTSSSSWSAAWRSSPKLRASVFTETRYEYQPGYYGTFYELTDELRRVPVRHVVVPTPDHLSPHPLLRDQLIMRLDEAGVRVWVVEL
jgi:hypothetical protein